MMPGGRAYGGDRWLTGALQRCYFKPELILKLGNREEERGGGQRVQLAASKTYSF